MLTLESVVLPTVGDVRDEVKGEVKDEVKGRRRGIAVAWVTPEDCGSQDSTGALDSLAI